MSIQLSSILGPGIQKRFNSNPTSTKDSVLSGDSDYCDADDQKSPLSFQEDVHKAKLASWHRCLKIAFRVSHII